MEDITATDIQARKDLVKAAAQALTKYKTKYATLYRYCSTNVAFPDHWVDKNIEEFTSGKDDYISILGWEGENQDWDEIRQMCDGDEEATAFFYDLQTLMERCLQDVAKEMKSVLSKYKNYALGDTYGTFETRYIGIVDIREDSLDEPSGIDPKRELVLLDVPLSKRFDTLPTSKRKKFLEDITKVLSKLLLSTHLEEITDVYTDPKKPVAAFGDTLKQFLNGKLHMLPICFFHFDKVQEEVKKLKVESLWPKLLLELRSAAQDVLTGLIKDMGSVITPKVGLFYGYYSNGEDMSPPQKNMPPVCMINLILSEQYTSVGAPFQTSDFENFKIIDRREYQFYKTNWKGLEKLRELNYVNSLAVPLKDRKSICDAIANAHKKLKKKHPVLDKVMTGGLLTDGSTIAKLNPDWISGEGSECISYDFNLENCKDIDSGEIDKMLPTYDPNAEWIEWIDDYDTMVAVVHDVKLHLQDYIKDMRQELKSILSKYSGTRFGVLWSDDLVATIGLISVEDTKGGLLNPDDGGNFKDIRVGEKAVYFKYDGTFNYNKLDIYSKIY